MIFTTVTIKRGAGPISSQAEIATGVQVQIDQKSVDMLQFDKGAAPFDWHSIYAWPLVPILRNDHLVDENNTSMVYTVDSRVETFLDGHAEMSAFTPIGS